MDPCLRIEQLFISTRTTTSSECLPKEMSALTRLPDLEELTFKVTETAATSAREQIDARADQAEFLFLPDQDLLRTATLSGKVHFEQVGAEPMVADAGRVNLEFAGKTKLQKFKPARVLASSRSPAARRGRAMPPRRISTYGSDHRF